MLSTGKMRSFRRDTSPPCSPLCWRVTLPAGTMLARGHDISTAVHAMARRSRPGGKTSMSMENHPCGASLVHRVWVERSASRRRHAVVIGLQAVAGATSAQAFLERLKIVSEVHYRQLRVFPGSVWPRAIAKARPRVGSRGRRQPASRRGRVRPARYSRRICCRDLQRDPGKGADPTLPGKR